MLPRNQHAGFDRNVDLSAEMPRAVSDWEFSNFSKTDTSKTARLFLSTKALTHSAPQPVNYIDQYIQNFHNTVEGRIPSATELADIAKAMFDMGETWDNDIIGFKAWKGNFPDPLGDPLFLGKNGPDELEGAYSAFILNIIDQHCK